MTTRAERYRFGIVPKRNFDPTAPLFVTRRLQFRGVVYERGDRLPDDIGKGKRFALWHSNRATNTPVVHFDRRGRFVPEGVPIARKTLTGPELAKDLAEQFPPPATEAVEGFAVTVDSPAPASPPRSKGRQKQRP